jgi:hypothetical protein
MTTQESANTGEQPAALMAGAHERRATAPNIPDILQRLQATLADWTSSAPRWERLVRATAGAAVLDDAGWPGLAVGLDRAAAAGWNVTANLSRLVTQQELPDRHQAAELYYRLVHACPAAAPPSSTSIADINGTATTLPSQTRQHAELARSRPGPGISQQAPPTR